MLDTNALFLPVRVGFPLESEIDRLFPGAKVVIADSGIRELDGLVEGRSPGAAGARSLARRFSPIPVRKRGDDAVVEAAVREHAVVVTADRGLQERLRRRGVTVLVPRDRHRLEVLPPRTSGRSAQRPVARAADKSTARTRRRGNG
ncbi:MAG: PIN domain-containing protein [Thermoplasmata archaeon]